jgi:hypothetical protein
MEWRSSESMMVMAVMTLSSNLNTLGNEVADWVKDYFVSEMK